MKQTWMLAALFAALPCAAQAGNRINPPSLERYYQLIYGDKLDGLSREDLAKQFMAGMQDNEKVMACDGMREMFADFAREMMTGMVTRMMPVLMKCQAAN